MSQSRDAVLTDHGLLVVWGQFAHCIGLIPAIQAISFAQKTVDHSPQGKVLEFLVAILGGLEYLKDMSLSARPLDKDQAVAQAWGQDGWADYSGVSRTLSSLTEDDVRHIAVALDQVTQSFIDQEVVLAWGNGCLELDGDLSPRPVSNTSTTYPDASYGHLNDSLRLGYQAAIVSLRSPTYGRIGLAATQHTGKTLSLSQAEALARDAERRLGRRPLRRTDLLAQRIERLHTEGQRRQQMVDSAREALGEAQAQHTAVAARLAQAQHTLADLAAVYEQRQRPERPTSALANMRRQVSVHERRLQRRQLAVDQARAWLTRQQARVQEWEAQRAALAARLTCFEAENAANLAPICAIFRLDAGFGSADNVALLIEMGYDVFTKPYGTWLAGMLAQMSTGSGTWRKVGANADMMAWKDVPVAGSPYPLDLGYERFWTGSAYRFSGLIHFGSQEVTVDLPGWFHTYNARQTIEAGNKEGKQVFAVHHLKVRSRPALRLQEHLALFAANFVRFAAHWLSAQCPQVPAGWADSPQPHVKEQVKVGAHCPAWIEWLGQDCLVRFDDRSVYAGRSFTVKREIAIQLALPVHFSVFAPT